jgi:hypothetical protein
MPFMVIYRTSDGSSCYEQADAIDEAALFVERLRNQDSIDHIRIYRMEEISFAFRPYYKVELGMAERQNTPTPPSASTAVVVDVPATDPEAAASSPSKLPPPPAPVDVADRKPTEADEVDEADEVVGSELPAPPRPHDDGETAGANGRRGLFGR